MGDWQGVTCTLDEHERFKAIAALVGHCAYKDISTTKTALPKAFREA